MPTRLVCGTAALLFAFLVSVTLANPVAAYEPPVDAPIVDAWRPPTTAYSAGNRGIDYQTVPGTGVGASEDGKVSFAGQVGGTNYVVIEHQDGLRTTYGGLNVILVTVGEVVRIGTKIALTGVQLHFGVRLGDTYLDPSSLFGNQVLLVPLDAPVTAGKPESISGNALAWLQSTPSTPSAAPVTDPSSFGHRPLSHGSLLPARQSGDSTDPVLGLAGGVGLAAVAGFGLWRRRSV